MRKVLTVGAMLIAVVAMSGSQANAKVHDTSIVGTGSSFVYPLVSKWISPLGSAYGISVTYSPTGSGSGISAVTSRTVDFGASDAPLSEDQLAACKCVVIPWALSATSIPYNLPGINGRMRLDGPTLANIYLGKITNWNDAAIKALNPKLSLPDLKITPVYRSDGSGTTYNFTEYLSSVSTEWKASTGFNTSVSWKAGIGARGSSGLAGVIKSTPGSIGYIDVAYSLANKFTFASIKNRTGTFATPGLRGIDAAVSKLPAKITNFSQLKIVDPSQAAGKLTYPIVTFTYVIIPSNASKAAELRKMVYWAVTQGQKFGPPLLFSPLPQPIQAFAFREIKKIG